jgi:peptide/nickel transport system substrate-binding protein
VQGDLLNLHLGSGQMQPLPMNELLKSQMDAAGFEVNLDSMDWNALLDLTRAGVDKYPDVNAINVSRQTQDLFNALIRAAKRLALPTKLNEMMNEEAALIFVAHDLNPRGLSPKVHGFVQAQSWFQDLTPVGVEP